MLNVTRDQMEGQGKDMSAGFEARKQMCLEPKVHFIYLFLFYLTFYLQINRLHDSAHTSSTTPTLASNHHNDEDEDEERDSRCKCISSSCCLFFPFLYML